MSDIIRNAADPEEPTQSATGDDATAAGMALVPGTGLASDLDLYDNQTRDYIANGHTRWKPGLAALPIAKGGTGATTVAAARNALGLGNTTGPVPVANGGTGASTPSAALAALGGASASATAGRNALGFPLAVADVTTSPGHALGMFYRADIARPVIRVDTTDFPVATWPATAGDLYDVVQSLRDALDAALERIAALEARP